MMKTEETLCFPTDYSSNLIIVQSMACHYSQQLLVRARRVLCQALFGSVCRTGGLVPFVFSHLAVLLSRRGATEKTSWKQLTG